MLGLPTSTKIKKQLSKNAIYAKFQMSNQAKSKFDEDVSRVTIIHEISSYSTNIPSGKEVVSFFVMLVNLKRKDFDEKNIMTLSKLVTQNMLFILEHEGKSKLATYRSKQLIQTEWKETEQHQISLQGLDLDKVWENIIIDIGEIEIEQGNSLDEQITADEQKAKFEKEIARLEKLARAEKQPKKKFELVKEIKSLQDKI